MGMMEYIRTKTKGEGGIHERGSGDLQDPSVHELFAVSGGYVRRMNNVKGYVRSTRRGEG